MFFITYFSSYPASSARPPYSLNPSAISEKLQLLMATKEIFYEDLRVKKVTSLCVAIREQEKNWQKKGR